MREAILIVDASPVHRQEKERTLREAQYHTIPVSGISPAMEWIRQEKKPLPDVVLLDIDSCEGAGQSIRDLKYLKHNVPIIAMTPYGDPQCAALALAAGAYDFVDKPVSSERLQLSIQNAVRLRRMNQYITWLERKVIGHVGFEDIIGESWNFLEAVALARQAAASSAPVWIEGEPGTGKTMLAQAIHGSGDRAGKPFVAVNCEILPPHLVESMLFGQEQSAASDDVHFIFGKIREADQGTLLLQEAGALPLGLQQQLITALKAKAIKPLGSASPSAIDVRLICTTSKPDKYYAPQNALIQKLSRLFSIVSITLPPLRERKTDMARLAEHFLLIHATSENKYITGMTEEARQWLSQYQWPGNVGQLANLIWRAVMLCEGNVLDITDLQAVQKTRSIYVPDRSHAAMAHKSILIDDNGQVKTLKSVEEEAIRFALQQTNGCMTRAARALGIGRSTLYRKVNEFSIDYYISRANQTTRPMMKVSSMERS